MPVDGQLRLLPPSRPLASFMASRVRMRIRSASNSASMANTFNSSLPTGSVGSYTDQSKMSLTLRRVSSSRMSRAWATTGPPDFC